MLRPQREQTQANLDGDKELENVDVVTRTIDEATKLMEGNQMNQSPLQWSHMNRSDNLYENQRHHYHEIGKDR